MMALCKALRMISDAALAADHPTKHPQMVDQVSQRRGAEKGLPQPAESVCGLLGPAKAGHPELLQAAAVCRLP